MSKYTTEIRFYLESGGDLFDFDYPIFDEAYRPILEQKIKDAYYFREIGFETIARFKHYLKVKLNLIMPYYNQMYDTENLITKDNYNKNLDTVESHSRTVDQTSDGSSTSTGSDTSVFSDTPQGRLAGEDYATNMTEGDTNMTATSSGTGTTTETYETLMTGGGGMRYNSDILMEWRKTFLRLDQMVIDELNELFMGIY